ncbi:hypothetical protein [Kosakonia quasisacchari]|uniref:hypothetical protein n=1 Tax=Kosakonia quasisacchari TaxID=2529380 RepID=UPI0039E18743
MPLPGNSKEITISDIREAHFYNEWLNGLDSSESFSPSEGKLHIFQNALNDFIHKYDTPYEVIVALEKECARSLLDKKHFRWLIVNKRATFWSYYYILNCGRNFPSKYQEKDYRTICERIENISGWELFRKGTKQDREHALDFDELPGVDIESIRQFNREMLMNHTERYEWIVSYFDRTGGLISQDKEKNLDDLRYECERAIKKDITLNWIDVKNTEQCMWAYEYLLERMADKNRFNSKRIHPDNNKSVELYDSCLLLIDLWEGDPDTLRHLLIKLNKAWSQKKLRDRKKDMKAIYISEPVKNMLDNIAKKNKMAESDLIEEIIKREYTRQK